MKASDVMGYKTWENRLSYEETKKVYKLIKKLIKCDSFKGYRKLIRRQFMFLIGEYGVQTSIEQLYIEFGMIPEESCSYYGHYENIKKLFGTDRHIVEISCGYFPVLANMIAREQIRTKAGTITAIDKSLFITKPRFDNMTLIRDEFTLDTDPKRLGLDLNSSNNLLVAIAPCDKTQSIIDYATKYGIDFYIAFCPCLYFEKAKDLLPTKSRVYEIYKEEYILDTAKKVRKRNMGVVKTIYLDDKYNGYAFVKPPIIYNRRRKRK